MMDTPLISVALLREQLIKKAVILDCRFNLADKSLGYEQYRQGHLPGAYYFDLERDLSGIKSAHGGRHPLPDREELAQKLRDAGVSHQTPILIYDDSRMAFAARAWWLLRYLGHDQVAILDGGYQAWCDAGGAIDRREPGTKAGNFIPHQPLLSHIDRVELVETKEQLTLIDSREPRRYSGLEEPIDPVAGHIPGAVNYPWQEITDEKGFIRPFEWHQQHWQNLAAHGERVVYCGSGVTACVNVFSLHLLGINAKLYPGSWSDWCSYPINGEISGNKKTGDIVA